MIIGGVTKSDKPKNGIFSRGEINPNVKLFSYLKLFLWTVRIVYVSRFKM